MKHLALDPAIFQAHFDRKPFFLAHQLGEHPLFALEELAALSLRLPPHLVEWSEGQQTEDAIDPDVKRSLPPDQTIRRIGERPAAVVLRRVEHDPRYQRLMDEVLDELQPLAEKVRPGMCRREAFIFLGSRATVTPFHFDPEHNFLMQIRGRKQVYMWDPQDRHVLSEREIEKSYLEPDVDHAQRPPYHDSFLPTAWVLPLAPGQGLNFPLHAPHWVRSESEVAISFSVTFRSRESRRRQLVHAANGRLRRLGLPTPNYGRSRLWDAATHLGARAVDGVMSRLLGTDAQG